MTTTMTTMTNRSSRGRCWSYNYLDVTIETDQGFPTTFVYNMLFFLIICVCVCVCVRVCVSVCGRVCVRACGATDTGGSETGTFTPRLHRCNQSGHRWNPISYWFTRKITHPSGDPDTSNRRHRFTSDWTVKRSPSPLGLSICPTLSSSAEPAPHGGQISVQSSALTQSPPTRPSLSSTFWVPAPSSSR